MTTDRRALVLDLETRSTVDLSKTNAYRYAQHPDTDVWLLRYAFTDSPELVMGWRPGEPVPEPVARHISEGGLYSAHNAEFEFAVHTYILAARYGWPALRLEQLTDTAARAARCGLPRSLEHGAKALGSPVEKDAAGSRLMKRMARPRRIEEDGTLVWWDVPDKLERLGRYCETDVRAQMEMELALPELPPGEWDIWQATLRSNYLGVQMDRRLIDRAQRILRGRLDRYAEELQRITHGQVKNHNDANGMREYLGLKLGCGGPLESIDKNAVAGLLAQKDLPDTARRVLEIRYEAGKSSVAKFPAMDNHANPEYVAQGQLVYYGAQATGRWSGSGIQLQNLPSRGEPGWRDAEWLIDQILNREDLQCVAETAEMLFGASIVEVLSMCLRGALRAREGRVIVSADYSNIEGRMAAWFGGEQWKLDAFRDFDAGRGPDLYKVTAASILAKAVSRITKTERNVMGKVPELALGFQGGAGAFASMGAVYGIDMEDYHDTVRQNLDRVYWEGALENWDTFGERSATVAKKAWIPSEAVKLAWRSRHPGIQDAWGQCERAAISAVETPGQAYSACDGKLRFFSKRMFNQQMLLMRLPSGRCIYYAGVSLKEVRTPWGTVRQQLRFMKVEKGRACRRSTYAGDIFQSAVQGGARDLMGHAWLTVEKEGYTPLFSVHDEMITEVPYWVAIRDPEDFEELMCRLPDWARSIPVSAGGYVSHRFRKD